MIESSRTGRLYSRASIESSSCIPCISLVFVDEESILLYIASSLVVQSNDKWLQDDGSILTARLELLYCLCRMRNHPTAPQYMHGHCRFAAEDLAKRLASLASHASCISSRKISDVVEIRILAKSSEIASCRIAFFESSHSLCVQIVHPSMLSIVFLVQFPCTLKIPISTLRHGLQ